MDAAISARDLVKTFGPTRALDGLDLEVVPGEVHGFLGPNGAGKSTTIRILLGLLRKDSGHIEVLGRRPWEDAVALHRNLAYVPGDVHLWPNLSGGEAIDLLGDLRGGIDERRRDELIERFKLDPTKRCSAYSKGNRQKVGLIAAFSSFVDLYLLDEPTSGLDPLMDSVFQRVVGEVKERGSTVLLSSHILAEAEKLCDRISIIREGRIVETGTLAQLRHLTRTTVRVETEREPSGLDQVEGLHHVAVDGAEIRFEVEPDGVQAAMSHLTRFGIRSLVATPPTLEELFMRHYGDELPADDDAGVAT